MTFQEFVKTVQGIELPTGDSYYESCYIGDKPENDRPFYRSTPDGDLYLVHKVQTGGVSGGSCWDDSNPQPYSTGHSLGRFRGLSTIVRALAPGINFLEYEDLLDRVETDTESHYEYYGNSTEYACQFIKLEDLWGFLSQCGLLD